MVVSTKDMCNMSYNRRKYKPFFEECSVMKEIRGYVHDETQRHVQLQARYRRGDISLIVDTNVNIHWRQMELVICFVLW
jgi:hypothetical protein